jgi:hypothetical protein
MCERIQFALASHQRWREYVRRPAGTAALGPTPCSPEQRSRAWPRFALVGVEDSFEEISVVSGARKLAPGKQCVQQKRPSMFFPRVGVPHAPREALRFCVAPHHDPLPHKRLRSPAEESPQPIAFQVRPLLEPPRPGPRYAGKEITAVSLDRPLQISTFHRAEKRIAITCDLRDKSHIAMARR